jgi:hypothetical protein
MARSQQSRPGCACARVQVFRSVACAVRCRNCRPPRLCLHAGTPAWASISTQDEGVHTKCRGGRPRQANALANQSGRYVATSRRPSGRLSDVGQASCSKWRQQCATSPELPPWCCGFAQSCSAIRQKPWPRRLPPSASSHNYSSEPNALLSAYPKVLYMTCGRRRASPVCLSSSRQTSKVI